MLIRNRSYATGVTALCMVFVCLALSVPTPSSNGEDLVRWVFLAGATYLALRAWRVGVIVEQDRVIKRGWFRTRTVERSSIVAVQVRPYEGEIAQGFGGISESRLRMIVFRTSGQEVKLPELVGYSKETTQMQGQLTEALGLPVQTSDRATRPAANVRKRSFLLRHGLRRFCT